MTDTAAGTRTVADPNKVPVVTVPADSGVDALAAELATATRIAIDTETWGFTERFEGHLRVLIVALRRPDGSEVCFVVDVRDVDRGELARALSGVHADGWNTNFDARVTDRDLFEPAGLAGIQWWDGMYADAVLHQGVFGFGWYHSLSWASKKYLGHAMSGKDTTRTSFDESSDLTDEQVRYAAHDGVITLWVGDVLRDRLGEAALERALELELRARPFLDRMERHGIPIDFEAWKAYLDSISERQGELLDRVAELTGGGQPNIFTGWQVPLWNAGSSDQLKAKLNEFDGDRVRRYFAEKEGSPRLFGRADKVDKDTLKELGGELASAVLAFRDTEKILKTYGENLAELIWDDGRMHPQYLQVVGTDTGRLSSRKPNAQNFTPKLKPFFRPLLPGRVFVYADLSQAELRFLAQVSGDEAMRTAFRDGRDIHEATAERMFGVDMAALKSDDPKQYKELRAKGKTLNFGIVYGLGAAALARSLTLSGVPTSRDEAKGLLDAYLKAYPRVAAWLEARDRVVRALGDNPPEIDIDATLRLADLHKRVASAKNTLRHKLRRTPDDDEVADESGLDLADVEWVSAFDGPVVLCADGTPFEFASYTEAGRRRRFQVSADAWMLSIAMLAVQRRHEVTDRARAAFEAEYNVTLSSGGRALRREDLEKVFEDRPLRRAYFEHMRSVLTEGAFGRLARTALADRIGSMGNAYRNAPIQGGVADVVLDAYGRLGDLLQEGRWSEVWPVQTVHDSITLEANATDAVDVAVALRDAMEGAMSGFCPDVPAVADADVRLSLDDSSVIVEIGSDVDLEEARRLVVEAVAARDTADGEPAAAV